MIIIDKLEKLKKIDPIVVEYIESVLFGYLYCEESDLSVEQRILLEGLLSVGTNVNTVELDKLFLSEFNLPYGDVMELDVSNIEYTGPKFINSMVGTSHVVIKYDNGVLKGTVYNSAM